MILGELIGLIALPIVWILFAISIIGMIHEVNSRFDRPIFDFIYIAFFWFGLVIGSFLLIWFFIVSGIGKDITSFIINLWNTNI